MSTPSDDDTKPLRRRRPAVTPDDREQELIVAATDLAHKQLMEGTASAQVITHYLKASSSREQLEKERLKGEVKLLEIRADAIAAQQRTEELFAEAIQAMRSYQGLPPMELGGGHVGEEQ